MATKSFKDICIEYATQLGKGLPLTPAEMCNALVMYLNQQVVDMQNMVQTALNAVKGVQDELESGKYATLSANNSFSGNNSFSRTVQANGGITINGKNVATENDIPSYTEFSGVTYSQEEGAEISYGNNKINLPIIGGDNINIDADSTGTHLQISAENVVTTNTKQNIRGIKRFAQGALTAGVENHYAHYDVGAITIVNEGDYYTLNFPLNKNGTIALTSDIPVVTPKYFTRVICHDVNNDTQYIFSCITEGDLSGNNVYGDVVSLLTELGAINFSTMLPCSGKTSAGGVVIGVYTDGSAITVISDDNATEEIPTSAEINIISK